MSSASLLLEVICGKRSDHLFLLFDLQRRLPRQLRASLDLRRDLFPKIIQPRPCNSICGWARRKVVQVHLRQATSFRQLLSPDRVVIAGFRLLKHRQSDRARRRRADEGAHWGKIRVCWQVFHLLTEAADPLFKSCKRFNLLSEALHLKIALLASLVACCPTISRDLNLDGVPSYPGGCKSDAGADKPGPCGLIAVDPELGAGRPAHSHYAFPCRLLTGIGHPWQNVNAGHENQRDHVGDQLGSARSLHRLTLLPRTLSRKLRASEFHSFTRAA